MIQIGYLNQKNENITDDIVYQIILNDKLQYHVKLDEEVWFKKELYDWHYNAFVKRPLINNGENIDE